MSNTQSENNEYILHDICVRCSAQDTSQPELDGLMLMIATDQRIIPLRLERVSKNTWKQRHYALIPVSSKVLVLVETSRNHGGWDRGYIEKDLKECLERREDLEWNLKLEGENAPALSVSFKLYCHTSDGTQAQRWSERTLNDPKMMLGFVQSLPDDNPIKADGLNAIGKEFRHKFAITKDKADLNASINAYEQALKLLSADDIRLFGFLQDTGIAYRNRFQINGNTEDIDAAIERLQRALAMLSRGHEMVPMALNNLGAFFLERFKRTGDLNDIGQSILVQQRAVSLTPETNASLPLRLNNLGSSFLALFEQSGDLNDIGQAIRLQQRAVELTPEGHADFPSRLNNLCSSFTRQFERTGDLHDVDQSIQLQQKAVKFTLEGCSDLPCLLNNLGTSFHYRFQRTGNLDDIGQSIQLRQKAMKLMPEGHADLPCQLSNLSNSFLRRFQRTRELHDINESIRLQQEAVGLTPEDHANLPSWLTNLGNSFLCRFEQMGDLRDIGESIQHQQRAVKLTSEGRANLPFLLNNLGYSLMCRFERTGELHDIVHSIQLQQRAVKLTPEGHADLPLLLRNLANSFLYQSEQTGDIHDIDEAIQHGQRAVTLTPEGHADLPFRLSNLGSSFMCRFERTGEPRDIEEAIQLQKKAVKLAPEDHAYLPSWLNNLAISFLCQFERTGDLHDVAESIQLQQRAVDLTPNCYSSLAGLHYSLGNSILARFKSTRSPTDIQMACSSYCTSAMSITGSPSICLKAARNWAQLSPGIASLAAHERVIELISLIAGIENTSRHRHELLKELSHDATQAAVAALSINRPSKAIEWLEAGRCIVWNQITQLRTPVDELRAYHPALADQFTLLSKQLEKLGTRADPRQRGIGLPMEAQMSLEVEAYIHLKLAKEREELLDTIREIPRFESFLRPRDCANLIRAVPDNGVVVILNSDDERCDAIIVVAGQNEPVHIPLDKFSRKRAQTLADGLRFHLDPHEFRSRYPEDMADPRKIGRYKGPSPGDDVKGMLRALWDDLVDPVLQFLGFKNEREDTDLPRIWWCPTGPFAFLPIHAAGIYGTDGKSSSTCLADYAVSSYIPTLSILDKLRSRSSDGSIDGTGVLLVSQPNTPGQSSIPNTKAEVVRTGEELEKRGIRTAWYNGEDATVARVSESMKSFSSVHLACHASQNITNPLESAIFLHDGALELSEIMKMDLPEADLAFLSACQTSVGARNLPEEAVHLAAGMLTAGYRSVVATMWSISDHHAPDVAETFYKCLMNDETKEGVVGLDITGSAQALHIAVQALRRKLGDSTEDLLKWIPYVHYGI